MAEPHEVKHGWMHGRIFRMKVDKMGYDFKPVGTDWKGTEHPFKKGELVKVVMVSRLGDCGITHDLNADHLCYAPYEGRVEPDQLEIVSP